MSHKFETISVVGLGYVGLPTAATLATRDVKVIGVDIREDAVRRINEGRSHILEPDLDIILSAAVTSGKLRAVTRPEPADAFLIAVPTPVRPDHTPDMQAVESATDSIIEVLRPGNLIVLESTSPVGTTEKLARRIAERRPDLRLPTVSDGEPNISMAYCPERILPGQTLRELIDNARIIGGLDRVSAERARDLYALFCRGDLPLTDAATAEMVKLTENAYRDVNIAFANELSMVCDRARLDVWSVIEMANHHPRVNILKPGAGVGGHCIPVDPWFIVDSFPEETPLIRTARNVNMNKERFVVERVRRIADRFRTPTVAVLGLSYKPDVDDLRESPALHIAQALAAEPGYQLLVVEPHVDGLPPALEGRANVEAVELRTALQKADIVLILVPHKAFSRIDPIDIREKVLIDMVGLFR